MLTLSVNMKLRRSNYAKLREKYCASKKTVPRIWSIRNVKRSTEQEIEAVRKNRKGICGKLRINEEEIKQEVSAVPLRLLRIEGHAAEAAGVPSSTLFDALKRGLLRRESNTVKLSLTKKTAEAEMVSEVCNQPHA